MPALFSFGTEEGNGNDLETIFEIVPLPLVGLSRHGTIRFWNRAAEKLTGHRFNDVTGTLAVSLVRGNDGEEWNARLCQALSTGIIQEFRSAVIRKDGSEVDATLTFTPTRDVNGLVSGILLSISTKAPSESDNSLCEWRERFEAALEASGLVLRDWKPEADEITCIGNVFGILGIPPVALCGGIESWAELIHIDDREIFMSEFQEVLRERGSFDLEYRLRNGSGGYTVVRDRGHLLVDNEGRIIRVTALVADISEQRALEDRLRHSQKMEAFGRLAGGVAHDFNNLLTVISGYTEMMKEEFMDEDPRRVLVLEVEKAANRAASLTGQLLAFSRQQVLKLRVLHLNDVLTDVGKMLRRLIGEHIKLIIEAGESVGSVRADLGQLEQVMINLAVNARDAMPTGGTLQIRTCNATLTEAEIPHGSELTPGDYVRLSVSDTGVGMSEDVRKHIFEPFFTTKEPGRGTGLGLATCYGIIRQCGGQIVVESVPNEGTTFLIYLPRVYEIVHDSASANGTVKPQGGSEVILLVEDDATVRKLSASVLTKLGYNVIQAGNGEEALTVARKPDVPRVDLLVTDMVMPKMGGRDLAPQLRSRYPEARVLFTSGYPSHTIDPAAFGRQVAFIQKPFIPKTLAAQVRTLLDI